MKTNCKMDGSAVTAEALQQMSYRQLQQLAKQRGVRANRKREALLAVLAPRVGDVAAEMEVAVQSVVPTAPEAAAQEPVAKKARKTLVEEVLEEQDEVAPLAGASGAVVSAPPGAWGAEGSPVRIRPVDETAGSEPGGPPPRSPRGIPLRAGGAIDFDAFGNAVRKK